MGNRRTFLLLFAVFATFIAGCSSNDANTLFNELTEKSKQLDGIQLDYIVTTNVSGFSSGLNLSVAIQGDAKKSKVVVELFGRSSEVLVFEKKDFAISCGESFGKKMCNIVNTTPYKDLVDADAASKIKLSRVVDKIVVDRPCYGFAYSLTGKELRELASTNPTTQQQLRYLSNDTRIKYELCFDKEYGFLSTMWTTAIKNNSALFNSTIELMRIETNTEKIDADSPIAFFVQNTNCNDDGIELSVTPLIENKPFKILVEANGQGYGISKVSDEFEMPSLKDGPVAKAALSSKGLAGTYSVKACDDNWCYSTPDSLNPSVTADCQNTQIGVKLQKPENSEIIECFTEENGVSNERRSRYCFSVAAEELRDEDFCAVAGAWEDLCRFRVAMKTGTATVKLCEKVYETPFCQFMIAVANNDTSICPPTEDASQRRRACYTAVAQAKKDYSLCKGLGSKIVEFQSSCIMDVAASTRDSSACEEIVVFDNEGFQETVKKQCRETVADMIDVDKLSQKAILANDVSYCKKIGSNHGGFSSEMDKCYYEIAQRTANSDICKVFHVGSTGITPESCYSGIAQKLNDAKVCDNISSTVTERMRCKLATRLANRK